ncbi:unnamed protein product [Echinostoma caproni]|uniref:Uncharacterized protein n=1 Tax=Echinostoma caproni TaxID=27848 RepID=A0A3P8LCG6_9TREM|nr:unnamed protein product [Echinostoma caproni]
MLRNLAFPEAPAKLPYESLKLLLLNHLLPTEFQAHERAEFNNMIRADDFPCREFILQLNKQASRCNYGDRLEEQMCDHLVAGISSLILQRKLLEKKNLTFADGRKICEQHEYLMKATSSVSVTLFQRQKTRPNRPPMTKCVPKLQQDSSGNKKRIHPCLSCGAYHLRSNCRCRNVKCHACGKTSHIQRVRKQPLYNLKNRLLRMTQIWCSLYDPEENAPNSYTQM